MSAPAVLIDIDACLAEFNGPFLAALNRTAKALGEPYGREDYGDGAAIPQTWHWFELAGFSKATVSATWAMVKRFPEWWGELPAYPDAVKFICSLMDAQEQGRLVPYFVTSRPSQGVADVTHRWLCRHGAVRPNVVVVTGSGTKGQVAFATGAAAILDDHGPNFLSAPGTTTCYLLDRPWNQDDVHDHRITALDQFLQAVAGVQVIPSYAPEAA